MTDLQKPSGTLTEPISPPAGALLRTVWALLGVACVGAGYLAWVSISHGTAVGCAPGSGCDKVLQSRWAYWMGIPVSIPALLVYGVFLAMALRLRKPLPADEHCGAWVAIICLSVVVAGAAVWFVGLQVAVIKAFCKFCLLVHGCAFLAAMLCLANIPFAQDPNVTLWASNPRVVGVPARSLMMLLLLGLCGVGVLAGGQWLVQKERNVVVVPGVASGNTNRPPATNLVGPALTNVPRATAGPASPNCRLIGSRLVSLYDGEFLLRLDDLPVMGTPDAPKVVVSLFDFTCHHCRSMHAILTDAQRRLSNQLVVVSLPMPMSSNCNPFVLQGMPSSSNSCELARLGLAVWRANRQAYPEFERWMFEPEKPPLPEQAEAQAAQLVGTNALRAALADPWIEQQITTSCQIHWRNTQATGRPAMPQLILGPSISLGPLNSVQHLLILLERYLGIRYRPGSL